MSLLWELLEIFGGANTSPTEEGFHYLHTDGLYYIIKAGGIDPGDTPDTEPTKFQVVDRAEGHFTYRSGTDELVADRTIVTELSSLKLGEQIKLASGGASLHVEDLETGVASMYSYLGMKKGNIVANEDHTGIQNTRTRHNFSIITAFETNGPVDTAGVVDYAVTFLDTAQNTCSYSLEIVMEEALIPTDHIHYHIYHGTDETGVRMYSQRITGLTASIGDTIRLDFHHPVEIPAGSNVHNALHHSSTRSGTQHPLQVRRGTVDTAIPYVKGRFRTFDYIDILVDNHIQLDGTAIYEHFNIANYLVNTTTNPQVISVYDYTDCSFIVRDVAKKFNVNSVTINIYNADGFTIDHVAILDKRDRAFHFHKIGTDWFYSEEGKGLAVNISSSHTASVDFGEEVIIMGEVINFAALPAFADESGYTWEVLTPQGTWLLGTKKKAGFYRSDGAAWNYVGITIGQVTAGEIAAGTETEIRRFSPENIASISANTITGSDADFNTIHGTGALSSQTTAARNVAVGYEAMNTVLATANDNIAIGHQAMKLHTVGINNTMIGGSSGANQTNPAGNTALGFETLMTNIAGEYNLAIGVKALRVSTGSNLMAIGTRALKLNTSGLRHTAVGHETLKAMLTNHDSTAIGYLALSLSTGGGNTAVGSNAGALITTGTNNICIGEGANTSAPGVHNEVVIGNANTTKTILKGFLGLGTVNPEFIIHCKGTTSSPVFEIYNSTPGFGQNIYLRKSRSNTLDTNLIVQENDQIGGFIFQGASGGNDWVQAAGIRGFVDGTPGAGTSDMPGRLEFLTTPDVSGTPLTRLTIDKTGLVGIASNLHVGSGGAGSFHVTTTNRANSIDIDPTTGNIGIGVAATGSTLLHVQGGGIVFGSGLTMAGAQIVMDGNNLANMGLSYPKTTNTYDFGTTSLRWKKMWGVDVDLSGDLTVAGNITITGGINGDLITNPTLTTAITGTCSVATSGNIVTGQGTTFQSTLVVGESIKILGEVFRILSIASQTSLTIDSNHIAGSGGTVPLYHTISNVLDVKNGATDSVLIVGIDGRVVADALLVTNDLNVSGDIIASGDLISYGNGGVSATSFAAGELSLAIATSGATDNVAIGYKAMTATTVGDSNVAIGYESLMTMVEENNNVAIGLNSQRVSTASGNLSLGSKTLELNTSGFSNIAIGTRSLQKNLVGNYNIAIGYEALRYNTASTNVAIGYHAGNLITTSTGNTLLGHEAGHNIVAGGGKNSLFGINAGSGVTSGSQNVFIGGNGGKLATTTSNAILLGYEAGAGVALLGDHSIGIGQTTVRVNTAVGTIGIGFESGLSNISGVGNVGLGYKSNRVLTFSTGNTAIGYEALILANAANNTALGYQAGNTTTTGANNICIGSGAVTSGATASNETVIGNSTTAKALIKGDLTTKSLNVEALNPIPASATATGTLGEIRVTAAHIYVCTATNVWKRTAIATW